MSAAEVCRRRRDIVLHIIGGTRSVVLHRLGAIIDLVCARGSKDNVRRIDVRLRDRALAVAVRCELIVARIAAERRSHRALDAAVLDDLVRAGVRIGGKGPARARAVVARDARRRRELIRSVDKTALIRVEHSRIGSRNRRRDRRIRRRAVIGLRHGGERHIHRALCDGIVIGCDGRSNRRVRCIHETIVICMRRIDANVVIHGSVARTRVLVRIDRRCNILRAVARDKS